jgi:transcriptional antiterminator Rof (Rho-off)
MGHRIDRCDVIDILEEAATAHRPVHVELNGSGSSFTDEVRDVVTEAGEDYAVFKEHQRIPVSEIFAASRT